MSVDNLSVNITDFRFASTTIPNLFHGFATAGDCLSSACSETDKSGNFKVDFNGTNFLLPSSIPYSFHAHPPCFHSVYKAVMSSDRQQWSGFCGGQCGKCWPTKLYLQIDGC